VPPAIVFEGVILRSEYFGMALAIFPDDEVWHGTNKTAGSVFEIMAQRTLIRGKAVLSPIPICVKQ